MLDITLNYSIFTYLYFLWFYTDDDAGDGNKINNIGIHKNLQRVTSVEVLLKK